MDERVISDDRTSLEGPLDRRSFHRNLLVLAAAPTAGALFNTRTASAADTPANRHQSSVPCRRSLVEYQLPFAEETHEMVKVPGKPMVLVSQMSNSHVVKLRLDPRTEEVTGTKAFPLGPPDARLHGLAVSSRHPGKIWATHEGGDRLLLVDPNADALDTPPRIMRTIDIPGGARGPHYVNEHGDMLWVTLKGTDHVLALNHTDPAQHWLFPAEAHPIFAARHPVSGDFYVSQDAASKLLHIDARTKQTSQIPIPAQRGSTPVGLVSGPGGIWVVLLGTPEAGTGTFGRIDEHGQISWHQLRTPEGQGAGLLHVAFDPPGARREPGLWLLGSSIVSSNVRDLIIRVRFDPSYTKILGEEVAALPTQLCKAHRLLPLRRTVLASELTTATVAQLTSPEDCDWTTTH
ncbi:hypothetical protein [Streptomyces gobiensis]|uniref:Vgb family protein n=1 Tax=Streptomyces gobiensis TaxID=2875706 RepID=UPI001E5CA7F6|nr:hypothetical protein [Streptomyces gobiensis]UGY90295.1 hypothetical protein test1122_00170 [Streptomyces gobiensis]